MSVVFAPNTCEQRKPEDKVQFICKASTEKNKQIYSSMNEVRLNGTALIRP